jgi:hypothetical protein
MSLLFCARLLVPLLGLAIAGQGAALAETVRARYSVSLIGLHIGEAIAHGSIEQANYKIELNARLTGVASWVAHVRMALQSSGFIRRSTVLPSAYATSSANDRMTRTLRMALNAGNVRAVEITPPFEDIYDRVPVTAANKRNILDPISALIMAVPPGESLVGPAACDRTLPIFDGVVRFDVIMSFVRTQQVSVPGYAGPVSVCAVRYRPIAGHKIDSESTRFMAQNREIEAWLAPVEPAHVVVPFRVQLKTLAGMAEVQATEFTIERDPVTAKREH